MSRLPPIPEEQMNDAQRTVANEITAGPRGEVRGPFVPLLHNPAATSAVQKMGEFLRFNGTLPGDLREMVILVVARHWTAQYEWFAHHRIALDEGLDPAVCDAIAVGRRPEFDDDRLARVYDFVVELHETKTLSEATFGAVHEDLGPEGVVELTVLCGHYNTIAMVLNGFDCQVPGGAKPLK